MQPLSVFVIIAIAVIGLANGDGTSGGSRKGIRTDELIANSHAGSATFIPSSPGVYGVQVAASDGCNTYQDEVTFDLSCASLPTVSAGENTIVYKTNGQSSTTVQLDGSAISPAGGYLSFAWKVLQAPENSKVTVVAQPTVARSSVDLDVLGTYQFILSAGDCCGTSNATVTIDFQCNGSPIVNAGPDVSVRLGGQVVLDGSKTFDPEKDVLSFSWDVIQRPPGSSFATADASSPAYTFVPDAAGVFTLALTVSDGCTSATDSVTITVECNAIPVAIAGDEQVQTDLSIVELDGSQSYDSDAGDRLVFSWRFLQKPVLSSLKDQNINTYNQAFAKFTPDAYGTYVVEMTASDCCSYPKSTIAVHVRCSDIKPEVRATVDKPVVFKPFSPVTIDACASSHSEDRALAFKFVFRSLPPASLLATDLETSGQVEGCRATFVPDVEGMYEVDVGGYVPQCTSDQQTVKILAGCSLPPVANAPDVTVFKTCSSALASIDATSSSDPENEQLSFTWLVSSVPVGSTVLQSSLSSSSGVTTSFTPDVLGTYTVDLAASDGCSNTTDRVRIFYNCNGTPNARAGPDVIYNHKALQDAEVHLDATASSDPEGDPLSFSWKLVSVPGDSRIKTSSLTSITTPQTSFAPDVSGIYELEVEVSDCCSSDTDRVIVNVQCNEEPTANAGVDQYIVQSCSPEAVANGLTIAVNGANSYDPESDALSFRWVVLKAPFGSPITNDTLVNREQQAASLTIKHSDRMSSSDEYLLGLIVSDGCTTVTDNIKITYCANQCPTALAGRDQIIKVSNPLPAVALNGSLSSDEEGDQLTFKWEFASIPTGSALTSAMIIDSSTAVASFVPDVTGEFELFLTVSDCSCSATDYVKVSIVCDNPPVANAGPDQTGDNAIAKHCSRPGVSHLDGSLSRDPNGGKLGYLWTLESKPKGSALNSSAITNSRSSSALFHPDAEGDYELRLTVTDGCSTLSDEVVVQYLCREPPHADAFEDRTYEYNGAFPEVQLYGKPISAEQIGGSYDTYSDSLTYEWEFVSVPSDSKLRSKDIVLGQVEILGGKFTPDKPGDYEVRLRVFGCCGNDSDITKITIICTGQPPARAGGEQKVLRKANAPPVTVSCQLSLDEQKGYFFSWVFSSLPKLSKLSNGDIADATSCTASFVPDIGGYYELSLVVTDGCVSASDTALIHVHCGDQPVANAGTHQVLTKVNCQAPTFVLDGSQSIDRAGGGLTHEWSIIKFPPSSSITNSSIVNRNSPLASFVPDVLGQYEAQLSVQDICFTVSSSVKLTYTCNSAPIVNAGYDQIQVGYPFRQVAFESSNLDLDNDTLTYSWSFVGGLPSGSQLRNEDIAGQAQTKASFLPDVPGVYILEYAVSDCCSRSVDQVKVTVNRECVSKSPNAVISADNVVKSCSSNNVIPITGTSSFDDDTSPDMLTFAWRLSSTPYGSALSDALIVNAASSTAYFSPDVVGGYGVELIVSDGCSFSTNATTVQYVCNGAPLTVASILHPVDGTDLGKDASIPALDNTLPKISLSARGSTDPESDQLSCTWSFISTPLGSCQGDNAFVVGAHGLTASFFPDLRGAYEVSVTCSDCCSSSTDKVSVRVSCNDPPVANATSDPSAIKQCPPYGRILVTAADSSDVNGDPLAYSWSFLNVPAGSSLGTSDITNRHAVSADFGPDVFGLYELQVAVSDGCTTSVADVQVKVECGPAPEVDAGESRSVDYKRNLFEKVLLVGSVNSAVSRPSYMWAIIDLPHGSSLSDDDISRGTTLDAFFRPDAKGTYTLKLTATDCCHTVSDTVQVNVTCTEIPPAIAAVRDPTTGEVRDHDVEYIKQCTPTTVLLDGSLQQQPSANENAFSYSWAFSYLPAGSKAKISNATSMTASFVPDVFGDFYELTYTVSDGCASNSDRIKVTYRCNEPPHANAGGDLQFEKTCTASPVTIHGLATDDDPIESLFYSWSFYSIPRNSRLAQSDLANAFAQDVSFVPDVVGVYGLELYVSDCCTTSEGLFWSRCTCMIDRVLVNVYCVGQPPEANAGLDIFVNKPQGSVGFAPVSLSGIGSHDADRTALSYKWELVSKPGASLLGSSDIQLAAEMNATFTPDSTGVYEFDLTVADCCYASRDRVKVTVTCDSPPTTMAGPDQIVSKGCASLGTPITLDGSGSFDPENFELECNWKFICKPSGSALTDADITGRESTKAAFGADAVGKYILELDCFDGCSHVPDEVVVNVQCNGAPTIVAESFSHVLDNDHRAVFLNKAVISDCDGDELSFKYLILSAPLGSALGDLDISKTTVDGVEILQFFPDTTGQFLFKLVVSDCCNVVEATFSVDVLCGVPPVANAGLDSSMSWDGESPLVVQLSASTSADPDTQTLSFSWKLVSSPRDSLLDQSGIENAGSQLASFYPDAFGAYSFLLTTSDGCHESNDTITITVLCASAAPVVAPNDISSLFTCTSSFDLAATFNADPARTAFSWKVVSYNNNKLPSVYAGGSYNGTVNKRLVFDRAEVNEQDDEDLEIRWTFLSVPQTSALLDGDIIYATSLMSAAFIPDVPGLYTAKLIVTEGDASVSDIAQVFVTPVGVDAAQAFAQAEMLGTSSLSAVSVMTASPW
eukprot:CAMPEP_0184367708 /NCGR_PEP_ID=MMETSP1089-20130417/159580_1 /TAXON_ID=38269 ORGANISM="Gloeochaete wittrockiana, Strain SAG46.84" /NCGR_SAMPLE_ID=MMETSP1089 /ASSEMBLY_ACC=CAM_ASM_000445 /LENGTH=2598 /DNA_ID=CAMNT_0026709795 /DNA_START=111 /DNA_END=7904 /DNA_ORIENTATION=+